jgi:hypothetical protein
VAVFVLATLATRPASRDARAGQAPAGREAADLAELWTEADVASRDLFLGPGGAALVPAPETTFQMLKKDVDGYSRGWDVRDPQGLEWSVKYGPEAQSEIVASRLTWAIGYHQPPMHHVLYWSMTGSDPPGPQTPSRFRPKLRDWHRAGEWSWQDNPFKGTQPLRGLLVLMRILNNWDLLDRNNAVFKRRGEGPGPRRQFMVLDLGASLGRTKILPVSGTRNDIDDFEEQGFIKGVSNGRVRFDDLGRRHRGLFADLSPADVRWTCERLNLLSDEQWRDAFRAAHYDEALAARFIRKLREKVQIGLKLQ